MELKSGQQCLLNKYLGHYALLIGARRTARLFRTTVQGILTAEMLLAARTAASSP
jgi:hypothetical protein